VSLLATAIGEESFIDGDGNGAFTAPDTFYRTATPPPPGTVFHDLGEPWIDFNENDTHDSGEPFYDFYNGAGELGVRNGPDDLFNGALCQDAGRCPPAGQTQKARAGIGAQNLIILSGSNPQVTNRSLSMTIAPGSSQLLTFWVRDVNGNAMPGSTTVKGAVSGGGLSIGQPTELSVPCTTLPANLERNGVTLFSYSVSVATGTTVGSTGAFNLEVKTPRGITTVFSYTVTAGP
jgi:hypothetical protein